ncbi:Cys-Gln thioester bond-forming surface protein [Catenulispora yoronensis]
MTVGVASPAVAQEPTAPFAAFQYGTNGCLEVGARDTQPKPYAVPSGYDITAGYPAFGYDPSGFTRVGGTNACRYNFYDKNPRTDPSAVVITSGYCVQYAAGQLSGTGYDPQAHNSTRNLGYVQRILQNYWPATDLPAVPAKATDTANTNRQRSGAVAMAIHYFTDGIVMPPDYQTPALYDVVMKIVDDVLTAVRPRPRPTPRQRSPGRSAVRPAPCWVPIPWAPTPSEIWPPPSRTPRPSPMPPAPTPSSAAPRCRPERSCGSGPAVPRPASRSAARCRPASAPSWSATPPSASSR